MSEEKHMGAQIYEWRETISWLRDNISDIIEEINNNKETPYWVGPSHKTGNLNQFFLNKESKWLEFAKEIENKTLLEIGGSCFGVSAMWTFVNKRIHIDPLLDKMGFILESYLGRSWYEGVKEYSICAEEFIPELENTIDGCIYCRNCLDHTKNPWIILNNIAKYAQEGCYLLLWNEITHPGGGDEGHSNITQDPQELENYIKSLGFDIIRPVIHGGPAGEQKSAGLDYGCIAIKSGKNE